MDDKRTSPRRRTLKSGKIVSSDGSLSIDCIVRNISKSGARLQVPPTVAVPREFTLLDGQGRNPRQATVIWRRGSEIGVRFNEG